ncbi:carbonyl reductase [NADPH] 1-like [Bombyx mandarina]|uniref:Carbonyl reductase [NADPH] 1-like n=1 Tax=Bombyx mandarina TaxID=7092 RepID=A0A6J2K3P6_BOMMA|nr:carbonyl reductase [NADPH] 1-like [Bombyx mandarina]
MSQKVAIIINGTNILGLAIVKALSEKLNGTVYFTASNEEEGLKATENLNNIGLYPKFLLARITDKPALKEIADTIQMNHGSFDILINNTEDLKQCEDFPTYEEAKNVIDLQYKSLLVVEQYLFPLLKDGGRVINVTNAYGHLSNIKNDKWIKTLTAPDLTVEQIDNLFVDEYLRSLENGKFNKKWFTDDGKIAEYKISMVARTALTFVWHNKYKSRNICVNAVYPRLLASDMESAEESIKAILYLIFEASPKLTGTFMWHNKKLIDWYDTESDYSCKDVTLE